ncbi:MAG: LptF/LptG family permease [Candidatus Kapaibacterium sp.]
MLIARYVFRQFILTLLFALIALCVIFIVVNLMETMDEFLDQNAGAGIITRYYLYYIPEILKLLAPVAVLLATLFTVGRLSTNNEITAMKSGGMSLYIFMLPLLIFSIFFSGLQLYFNGWIVPKANSEKLLIEREYLNKSETGGPIYNLYFRDAPGRNVIMQHYDWSILTGINAVVEEYSSELKPRLVSRTESERIKWDSTDSRWIMYQGVKRDYTGTEVKAITFDSAVANIDLSHNQLIKLQKSPDEMTFDEYRDYIELLKQGGKDVRRQLIDYHGQLAFPVANIIVILFGVPFASVKKKGGIAVQIGAAMVISFSYMIFAEIGQTIGYASNIHPVISGWMANILFLIAGLVNLFKTRT